MYDICHREIGRISGHECLIDKMIILFILASPLPAGVLTPSCWLLAGIFSPPPYSLLPRVPSPPLNRLLSPLLPTSSFSSCPLPWPPPRCRYICIFIRECNRRLGFSRSSFSSKKITQDGGKISARHAIRFLLTMRYRTLSI